jgi:hypothetical protein
MLGAYTEVPDFAYPGWRLTIPGGPAGGHYKGFTHTQAAGTDILPADPYEQDREDGMSSHDAAHASPRNPRGVYRSAAEVPPRPNASGAAMTYRGVQTKRHAGTSIAPGAFPADFIETPEDFFVGTADDPSLGYFSPMLMRDGGGRAGPGYFARPGIVSVPISDLKYASPPVRTYAPPPYTPPPVPAYTGPSVGPVYVAPLPATGATSVVRQPTPTQVPLPPSPAAGIATQPPISPQPSPVVATHDVVPANDGSGNYIDVSTGAVVPASSVTQNPATGQWTTSGALSWLEEHSIWSAVPNWGVLAGGMLLAATLFRGRR